ncbi:hypothetical protein [Erwinia sp. SLM-02]|uniref:hypothetical protein n=1 Tax=Erwinia sp. SLM-02 TaxID=3020057 RepID=UPI00308101C3
MDIMIDRIEQLEKDTGQIKIDLACLTARSEAFATKTDLAELRTEMHQSLAGIHKEIGGMHKELANQTRWIMGTAVAIAATCMTIVKVFF